MKNKHKKVSKTYKSKEKEKDIHADLKPVREKDLGRTSMEDVQKYSLIIEEMKKEVSKAVIGQGKVIDSLISALLCNGHVLLEGVPGIAKTLAIRTLAVVSGCSVERIQFTVDLLPTDITGVTTYTPGKGFETLKGPLFANYIIADEINRSPPKTQSALMEAMQERQVTIGKETYKLPAPFFVMATQNPLESSGVYLLPEAQLDRFLFKVLMGYPEREEENEVMGKNITLMKFEDYGLKPIVSPGKIIEMQNLTKKIFISPKIRNFILDIVEKTRNKDFKHGEFIEWGGSPRASIALFIASKSRALIRGRNFVIPIDVKEASYEVLRHRIILNYRATAENVTADDIIDEVLEDIEFK